MSRVQSQGRARDSRSTRAVFSIEGNERTHLFQRVLNFPQKFTYGYVGVSTPDGKTGFIHMQACRQSNAVPLAVGCLLHLGLAGLGVGGGETISRSSMLKDKNVVMVTRGYTCQTASNYN